MSIDDITLIIEAPNANRKKNSKEKNNNLIRFKDTSAYKILNEELTTRIKKGLLNTQQVRDVINFSAIQYYRFIDNKKNAWNNVTLYLQIIPKVFSIIDLITIKYPAIYYIYIINKKHYTEVCEIFNSIELKQNLLSNYNFSIEGIDQVAFTLLEKENLDFNGKDIFHIIRNHFIPLDFHYYCWSKEVIEKLFWGDTKNHSILRLSLIHSRDLNDNKYGAGFRNDLNCAFRSVWEANIARVLNYHHIAWEYEKQTITLTDDSKKNFYYLPDFFLNNDTILEVKGFWDSDSRKKIKFFNKNFPNKKLYLIDQDCYYSIKNKYHLLIEGWENDNIIRPSNEKIQVIGLSFGDRKETLKTLEIGQNVILKRDLTNKFDFNAILVLTEDKREIGFISSDWAAIYAQKIDIGITYNSYIISIDEKVVTIDIIRDNLDADINLFF